MVRLAAILILLYATPAFAETWRAVPAELLKDVESITRDGETGSVKVRAAGQYYRLTMADGRPVLQRTSAPVMAPRPKDAIPHSRVATGANDIAQAWLAGATGRYAHGVLGDEIEASKLQVRTRQGKQVVFTLREDSVFEDLVPRLTDIDGDGRDEILLVRSHVDAGAAVMLLGLRGDRIVRLAESQAIGLSHRWLNPIGAADFDGDGRIEIAVVETPHLGGQLVLYDIQGSRLREVGRYAGFSTHVIGSTTLDMFALLDVNDDDVVDIVLPDQTRRKLHAVSLIKGHLSIIATVKLARPVTMSIVAADLDRNGEPDIVFGDKGGFLNVIQR